MTAWTMQGSRRDVELAVAMEVAVVLLKNAETAVLRAKAMEFSQRLWSVVGRLVEFGSEIEHAAVLAHGADQVARGALTPADLIDLNRQHAAALAGRKATEGALKRLLEDWRAHCKTVPQANFGSWLVDRLAAQTTPGILAA